MFTSITATLATYQAQILILIFVAIVLLLALLLIKVSTLQKRIDAIPHLTLSEEIMARLSGHDTQLSNHKDHIAHIEDTIALLNIKQAHSYRSYVHRYNPFRDSGVGGNQSFSIALANDHGDGLLITSLYSREMNRVSSKPLTNWTNDEYTISPEEQVAIDKLKDN